MEAAFLAAIDADDGPGLVLVYADWLDEQGRCREGQALRDLASMGKSPKRSETYRGSGWFFWVKFPTNSSPDRAAPNEIGILVDQIKTSSIFFNKLSHSHTLAYFKSRSDAWVAISKALANLETGWDTERLQKESNAQIAGTG